MSRPAYALLTFALMVVPAIGCGPAFAQGTQNPNTTPAGNSRSNGMGTNSPSDPMGGAFKGTGTPTFGTSPGMGSDTRQQRRN